MKYVRYRDYFISAICLCVMAAAPSSSDACDDLFTAPKAGVVVLIRRGSGATEEFLFARRAPAKDNGGIWAMISGKVEEGETHEQAVVRELHEELGVRVVPGKALFSKVTDNRKYELFWWSARLEEGELPRILAKDENTEWAWLTLAQIQALEAQGLTFPRATEFMRKLIAL